MAEDHPEELRELFRQWQEEGIGGDTPITDPSAWIATNEIYRGLRAGGFTETQSLRIIAVLIVENGARAGDDEINKE